LYRSKNELTLKTNQLPKTLLNRDTFDLSNKAYKSIIIEAERFDHNLTLYYGMISGECEDEIEYLRKVKRFNHEVSNMDVEHLNDLFFGEPFNKKKLYATIKKVNDNLDKIRQIPKDKRHYE
jgi:hypothetical protein